MTRAECAKILRLVCRNALRGPQYRLPQRLRAEYGLRQHVVHHVLRRILHHGDFFQNHAALLVHFLPVQRRVAHDIRQYVRRQRQILVDHLGVIIGTQLAGRGVQMPAHRIHFLGNLPRGTLLRAFEGHMLHKMRQAVFLRRFQHRSCLDPHADRRGTQIGHGLHQQRQSIFQRKLFHRRILLELKNQGETTCSFPLFSGFMLLIGVRRSAGHPGGAGGSPSARNA